MNENELRKIVHDIEVRYANISNEDWYQIVQILAKRADI